MKSVIRHILSVAVLFCLISGVQAQSVKVNIPFWLTGSPNVGFEYTLTRQLTVNGEVLWMPYLFKKHEEVFRALQSSVELRYYVNPRNFYTNDSWDGFYIGPYAMYGNFNTGLIVGDHVGSIIFMEDPVGCFPTDCFQLFRCGLYQYHVFVLGILR